MLLDEAPQVGHSRNHRENIHQHLMQPHRKQGRPQYFFFIKKEIRTVLHTTHMYMVTKRFAEKILRQKSC